MNNPLDSILIYRLPHSSEAEKFRMLRTNLLRFIDEGVHTILFASAWPSDGKSLLCSNLAVSLAQVSRRVILVDADMRRPTLTHLFAAERSQGLSDALQRRVPIASVLQPTALPGLHFLPSGTHPVAAADLISGELIRPVLADLAGAADCVLIDTPPLTIFADAMSMATLVDGVIMVIKPGQWQGEAEVTIKRDMEKAGARILGVVLNDVPEVASSYAYKYKYYPSNGSPPVPPTKR